MFICKKCLEKHADFDNNYVLFLFNFVFKSYGACEFCSKTEICIDWRVGEHGKVIDEKERKE